ARTGAGKTHLLAEVIILNIYNNIKSTIMTDSIDNVNILYNRVFKILEGLTEDERTIEHFRSRLLKVMPSTKIDDMEYATVLISHHQYLTFKGLSGENYPKTEVLIKDRNLFIDEVQGLGEVRNKSLIVQSLYIVSDKYEHQKKWVKVDRVLESKLEYNLMSELSHYKNHFGIVDYITRTLIDDSNIRPSGVLDYFNLDEVIETRDKFHKVHKNLGYREINYKLSLKMETLRGVSSKELEDLIKLAERCTDIYLGYKYPIVKDLETGIISDVEINTDIFREFYKTNFTALFQKRIVFIDDRLIRSLNGDYTGFSAIFNAEDGIYEGIKHHHNESSFSKLDKIYLYEVEGAI
ncbi:MAG: hypothetical protein ACRC5T_02985, partial [Cetobacterium sp.]